MQGEDPARDSGNGLIHMQCSWPKVRLWQADRLQEVQGGEAEFDKAMEDAYEVAIRHGFCSVIPTSAKTKSLSLADLPRC